MLLRTTDPSRYTMVHGTLMFVESVRDTLQLKLRVANILEILCSFCAFR